MTSYKYSFHVKVVGIIEIVLQTLTSILMLVQIGMLVFGVSIIGSYHYSSVTSTNILGTKTKDSVQFDSNMWGTKSKDPFQVDNVPTDAQNAIRNDLATVAPAISAIIITSLVILIVANIVGAWMVYLVFTGGQTENSSRLTLWYIIESVLFSIGLLLIIITIFSGLSQWYLIILTFLFVGYRVYSIHVVRCHAAEIKLNSALPNKF